MRTLLMICVLLLGPTTEALVSRPQRAALGDLTALVERWARVFFSASPPTGTALTPLR